MSKPYEEEGYEIADGKYAQEFWWPKDHHVHQCWELGEWHEVGKSKDFHSNWTYRRPIPPTPGQGHFI